MAALGNTLTIPEPLGLFRTSNSEVAHTLPHAGYRASFALRLAQEREWVRIVGFQGSEGFHSRLAGMGLHIGAEIQVLCNPMDGKLLIGLEGTRLFLGGGMAQKIQVVPMQQVAR